MSVTVQWCAHGKGNPKQLSLLIGQLQTLQYAYNMHINLAAT